MLATVVKNMFLSKWFLCFRRGKSNWLADVIKGNHNNDNCKANHWEYQHAHKEELQCKFTGQADKIQNLLRKKYVKKEEN